MARPFALLACLALFTGSAAVEGRDYPLRAVFVQEQALRGRIVSVFREKYGFSDAFIGILRGSDPRIMRLEPRS